MEPLWVYFREGCFESVCDQLLNLREDISVEVKVDFGLLRTDNLCKVLPTELVSILKLAVVVSFLLDRIVCQMNELVGHIVKSVLPATRSDIAVLVAIAFQTAINARQQSKATEVKLALVNE